MRCLRVLLLVCLLSLASAGAWAEAGQPVQRPVCSLTRCTPSEQRFADRSLQRIQRRGNFEPALLNELVHNPTAKPFLPKALNALGKVDRMPGTLDVVKRLSRAHDEGSARGAAFELFAGAALRQHLKRLSTVVQGNEWDGELRDGTVVSMKSITTASENGIGNVLRHATKQLIRRTQDGRPAMLVIGHEPGAKIRKNWAHMAKRLGSDLSVVLVQHKTGRYRTIFTTLKKNPLTTTLKKNSLATTQKRMRKLTKAAGKRQVSRRWSNTRRPPRRPVRRPR